VALSGNEQEVRIKHTPNAIHRLEEAHKLLGLSNHLYQTLDSVFNRMAMKKMTGRKLTEFVNTLFPTNPDAHIQTKNENIREIVHELHETGQGAEMSRGTLWGAYNAITEYTDHVQHSRDASKQLKSMWFGGGERLKLRAFALAQQMMTN
jgi:hypothetical protein